MGAGLGSVTLVHPRRELLRWWAARVAATAYADVVVMVSVSVSEEVCGFLAIECGVAAVNVESARVVAWVEGSAAFRRHGLVYGASVLCRQLRSTDDDVGRGLVRLLGSYPGWHHGGHRGVGPRVPLNRDGHHGVC